jgi:hypothetical protein
MSLLMTETSFVFAFGLADSVGEASFAEAFIEADAVADARSLTDTNVRTLADADIRALADADTRTLAEADTRTLAETVGLIGGRRGLISVAEAAMPAIWA